MSWLFLCFFVADFVCSSLWNPVSNLSIEHLFLRYTARNLMKREPQMNTD
jgi:hypothetical protein